MDKKKVSIPNFANQKKETNKKLDTNIQQYDELVKSNYKKNSISRFILKYVVAKYLLANEYISLNSNYYKCSRSAHSSTIELYRNSTSNRAYYQSIITCSSWLCPVCAPRIIGKRSAEVRQGVHYWLNENNDNTCYLMTLTFAHSSRDRLRYLLNCFKKATKKFWGHWSVINILKECERVGRITSTEIQYSEINGFHPHQHVLIFCKKHDFDKEKLANLWVKCLNDSGLTGLKDIAFNIIEARSADNYLTKLSSELTLGNIKEGRTNKHFSPIQLMQEVEQGKSWAISAFGELYQATRGMHWLSWSKGLKDLLGIKNITDKEITEDKTELKEFLTIYFQDFKTLKPAEKGILQYYAGYNEKDNAEKFLHSKNIKQITFQEV